MEKLKMHSPDLVAGNIDKIAILFPNCVTETRNAKGDVKRAIDFDKLRQELSNSNVEGAQERYRLDWPGKNDALLVSNAPIAKTLRPCPNESVNFSSTKNIFIEGDNLDALKLLQESYLGKIKMIYIDPPYNTGNDFVYDDNFTDTTTSYFQSSNQADDLGRKLITNTEANGRYHSDWLSLIYPRLRLARNLLREDGFLFISIDDVEVANLRKIGDEIFGEQNFVAQLVWKSRVSEDTRAKTGVSTDHEYIICYSRGGETPLRGSEKDTEKFSNLDNDQRGPWRSADLTGLATKDARPNLHYALVDPKTGIDYGCPPKGWRYEKSTMAQKIAEGRILFPESPAGRPRHKLFLNEMRSLYKNISSVITGMSTADGTREINSLLGQGVFSFPKPTSLISTLIEQTCESEDIILDFFAGSGTSGHAVFSRNILDGTKRRFILVQLPEPLVSGNPNQKAALDLCDKIEKPRNIAEITKERLRRASAEALRSNVTIAANQDLGFRVFKIDTSNAKDVYYSPDNIVQADLLSQADNIREDRTPDDLLFQVLIDSGLDLALPISHEVIAGKTVFFVDGNALAACFENDVSEELVTALAKRRLHDLPLLKVVFRDASFRTDSIKINVEQIFKLLSPSTEIRSL